RAHDEIHYLVPKDFKVDGIISSNGTNGVVHNETIFKHSLTFDTVNEIVKRAKAQAIYYEVFHFDGNRIILNEDQTWAEAMLKQLSTTKNVVYSELTSLKESIVEKVSWEPIIPDTSFSKIYLFSPDYDKITQFRNQLIDDQTALQISVSNSSR